MTNLSIPEPAPIPNNNPAIVDLVIADMLRRKALGIKEYKVPLQAGNGRDPQQDRYDELIDAIFYLKQEMEENKLFEIHSLVVKRPKGKFESGIFVEAFYFHNSFSDTCCKKWRIRTQGVYFYGKDKSWIHNHKDEFNDNYCWDNMKEAFLFAQENLIEKPVQETNYSVLGDK
jgi:hypothetical protein